MWKTWLNTAYNGLEKKKVKKKYVHDPQGSRCVDR